MKRKNEVNVLEKSLMAQAGQWWKIWLNRGFLNLSDLFLAVELHMFPDLSNMVSPGLLLETKTVAKEWPKSVKAVLENRTA